MFEVFIKVLSPDKQAIFRSKRYWISDGFKTELYTFIHEFNKLSEKPTVEKSLQEGKLTVKGHFANMSEVLPLIQNSGMRNVTSVNIFVTHSFLFDIDYTINSLHQAIYERHAPDLVIISPKVAIEKPITVDLSCVTMPGYPNNKSNADDGQEAGARGSDGEPGLSGYNGGTLYILTDSIQNREMLTFISGGGKGGPGQNGTIVALIR